MSEHRKVSKFTPITVQLVAIKNANAKIQFPVIGVTEHGAFVIAGSDHAATIAPGQYDIMVRDWLQTFGQGELPRITPPKKVEEKSSGTDWGKKIGGSTT